MYRFFVYEKVENYFIIPENTLKHIKVARLEKENFICVFNKTFYECKLQDGKAEIVKIISRNNEFLNKVIIASAIIDIKRFEWMIQKATELGVNRIVPFVSQRVNKKTTNLEKKNRRWNQIAISAAEQSFRNDSPIIESVKTFEQVALAFSDQEHKFIAHEKTISKVVGQFPTNSVFLIGPEGGFTDEEIDFAIKQGYKTISLGKRILRAETAPLFILSNIR